MSLIFQVANPVPRVAHPDWLHKKVREKEDKFRQKKIMDMFSSKQDAMERIDAAAHDVDNGMGNHKVPDLEDFGKSGGSGVGSRPVVHCYEANGQHSLQTTTSLANVPILDIDKSEDYVGWLEQKKRKWKENREKRKRQRFFTIIILFLFFKI